ncbi:MAG: hypothetical protein ACJAUV_002371 [Flavobacteriales bacterium]|jgi:hypothetical protein
MIILNLNNDLPTLCISANTKNNNMRILLLILITAFLTTSTYSQSFPEKELLKSLKADRLEMDKGNEDGVFKARNKKTKKWGMFQWMFEGVQTKELIPMHYDSLRNIPFNGAFSAVYNNGKIGFYLSEWSYAEKARQSVPCIYEDYQRYNNNGTTYLAAVKEGKWGWVDWLTGDEKSNFAAKTKDDLPYINYVQKSWVDE